MQKSDCIISQAEESNIILFSLWTQPLPGRTWVCGRDDGTKEEAVGVVELVRQLSDHLHQLDHAVHQVPVRRRRGTHCTAAPETAVTASHMFISRGFSPDHEAGDGGAQECIGYDGAQVPEEVSLEEESGELS